MTSIALRPFSVPRLRWNRPEPTLFVGQNDGEFAGLVEQRGGRFIATDALGTVIGTFDTERRARAALEPDALERSLAAAARRTRILTGATGAAALISTGIAIAGMLTILA